MVCGCLPFDEPDMDVLYDRIIAGDYDFSPAPRLSPDVRHLIRGLLHMPPEQRLTARQVMGHRWLRSVAAPPAMSLGLLCAVVDPACRQLLRTLEAECELVPREVRRRAADASPPDRARHRPARAGRGRGVWTKLRERGRSPLFYISSSVIARAAQVDDGGSDARKPACRTTPRGRVGTACVCMCRRACADACCGRRAR